MVDAALVEAIATLVQALVWPAIFVLLAVYFGDAVREFLVDLGEITLTAGGLDVTASRQQGIKAAALIGAATERKPSEQTQDVPETESAQNIAVELIQALTGRARQQLTESTILWVDDEPSNNIIEREALSLLGIRVTTSRATETAREKLQADAYDLVITDMGRGEDTEAGFTLLAEIRDIGEVVPVIIYTGRDVDRETAGRRGAFGVAADPPELFMLILRVLLETR